MCEIEGDSLLIHNVFAKEQVSLDTVIGAFGTNIRQVTLGFSPVDEAGFEKQDIQEEDCTFFIKGKFFDDFEGKSLRIPSLAHV